MGFTFVIIGDGVTATSMLDQFTEKLRQENDEDLANLPKVHIQIFEKHDTFEPGFPPLLMKNLLKRRIVQKWISNGVERELLKELLPAA